MMRTLNIALLAAAFPLSLASPQPARAADKPTAMVESLAPAVPGLNAMDYLQPGRTITLPDGGTLVLDYLASCVRETITGGIVHIGADQSEVEHGKVHRAQVDCDGADLQLTAAQSDAGGVAVYRALGQPTKPTITVFATTPVVVTTATAPITLQRVDTDDAAVALGPPTAFGERAFIDFARIGRTLVPGGVYRLTQDKRVLVFRVDANAGAGALPLVQRMLPL